MAGKHVRRRARARHSIRGVRPSARGMLSTAGAIFIAITVGVTATAGSYALWNDSRAIAGTEVSSGTLDLTVTGSLDPLAWQDLLPGEHDVQWVMVSNTADVDFRLSVVATTASPSFEVRLDAAETCGPTVLGDPVTTATDLTVLAAADTLRLCVDVSLSPTGMPGDVADITMTVLGTQERP